MWLKLSIKVASVRRVLLVIVGRIDTPWLYVINRPAQKGRRMNDKVYCTLVPKANTHILNHRYFLFNNWLWSTFGNIGIARKYHNVERTLVPGGNLGKLVNIGIWQEKLGRVEA